MRQNSGQSKVAADKLMKGIRGKTRKHYSAEEKIRVVLAGLRGEENSPPCAARKASRRACITAGPKSFLKLGRSGWLTIRHVRRRQSKLPV